ncbi:hypothetical protein ACO0K3_10550 [Undibacterium sp. Rencai35W]|uniref:hypothetical protein n=1 Tax=Undibacterium sp. Rencai35W TaxID=3413046 RepID=UPI003BF392D0
MITPIFPTVLKRVSASHLVCLTISAFLVACGGAGTAVSGATPQNPTPPIVAIPPVISTPPATPTTPVPPVNAPDTTVGLITSVKVQNTGIDQSNVPFSFGHVFAKGDVVASSSISAKLSDGSVLPLQLDVKASHDDGSWRHAVVSGVLPKLMANQTETISLLKNTAPNTAPVSGTPSALLTAGFTASATAVIGGVAYSASADDLLKSGQYTNWLAGSMVNEWLVSAPLKTAQGATHPHLTARFAIRSYTGQSKARVDVTIENNWAYEPAPQNITYDAQIKVAGQSVYTKSALTHYHHARWRKLFWWGAEPQVHIRHNTAYLIASKAVPNYDQSIVFSTPSFASIKTQFTGAATEPMGNGMALPSMPSPGGRPDIGLMPGWAASYLLSMDKDAKQATLGTADLAGSWSMHYRDKNTDRPISLLDYPYMTILGNSGDTFNPATKKLEAFPACGGVCTNPNVADSNHEPDFSYLPYLVTGDYYHLEELQFWTMWNLFQSNPGYRDNIKGLFNRTPVRGQAWILRSLAETAFITPDKDALKSQFATFLATNLDWYNTSYTNNPKPDNTLGAIFDLYSTEYNDKRGIAPWMDDFFTSAAGRAAELGYTQALPLLKWKAKFPISRMNDPSYCWILGAIYSMNVRDTATSSYYTTIGQAYLASSPATLTSLACNSPAMAANLGLKVGEMTGYAYGTEGFPSNMQPALAYSVDSGVAGGADAWKIFMSRSVKPDYSTNPEFAVIPR